MIPDLKFSVLIPVYNGGKTIVETIQSILCQSFTNFELIVQDNASTDNTAQIVMSFSDSRIKYFKNKSNLGPAMNMEAGKKNCSGDILYLMAADDILLKDALLNTYKAFKLSDQIGAVTRPYYWFSNDMHVPIRVTKRMGPNDEVVSIHDDFATKVRFVLDNEILGQLSGLAFRIKYMDTGFPDDPWIPHGYPMVAVFKKHPVVFLKDYTLAVRIAFSETRRNSSLYDYSPTQRWIDLFQGTLSEPGFERVKRKCIREIIAINYVGLVQIRNFGKYSSVIKEIWYLFKYRWENIFNPRYWFFSIGTLIMPVSFLRPLVDWYKEKMQSLLIRWISENNFSVDQA